MSHSSRVFVVSARRSALGRIGGLHRERRVPDLTAPVIAEALKDARIGPAEVGEVILGNVAAGGNPARLVALAAGLPETIPALTVTRHEGSGLDAIALAAMKVRSGEAEVILAGGAESLSTAPWRLAKPRSIYHFPRIEGLLPTDFGGESDAGGLSDALALARKLGLDRRKLDAYAHAAHQRAEQARAARAFVGEIVLMRGGKDETRDESAVGPDLDEIADEPELPHGENLFTRVTTAQMHDGAAFAVVVSEALWRRLGSPPALEVLSAAAVGVPQGAEAPAFEVALLKALSRIGDKGTQVIDPADLAAIELGESSAVEPLALIARLGLAADRLNPAGGAIVRGVAPGAAGAVLVARLFTDLVRRGPEGATGLGAVVQGVAAGMGVAAVFRRVG